MGSIVLLDLMGGVALLLWGLHMVHSGILRAFGPDLRLLLARARCAIALPPLAPVSA
ncbi:Na+/phosphate symporter [Bradyrhizobium elkanii]